MPALRELMEACGADYAVTMARFLGNEELYLKYVKMLFSEDGLRNLEDSLEANDLSGAFEAAHTLKGVTATLGLTTLNAAISRIVEPLRTGETRNYLPEYRQIEREFQRLRALVRASGL